MLRTPNNEYIAESLSIKTKPSEVSTGVAQERTIKQVLQMKNFWCLWTYLLVIQLGAGFFYTYQKSFGLVYINDDSFFSTIGILSNVLNGSARIIWGKMYDFKGFRFNSMLVALIATGSCLAINLVMYIPEHSQMGRKVFFAVVSLIFYGAFPGLYTLMAPTIHGTFGHLNYARDYGLVFTQAVRFLHLNNFQILLSFSFPDVGRNFNDTHFDLFARPFRILWNVFAIRNHRCHRIICRVEFWRKAICIIICNIRGAKGFITFQFR